MTLLRAKRSPPSAGQDDFRRARHSRYFWSPRYRRRHQQVGSLRSAESWASRPSSVSPAPSTVTVGYRRTRSPVICSAGWCPGVAAQRLWRNGARLYPRRGSHPEYATAECDNLVQPVTHDRRRAGVEDLLVDAEQRLATKVSAGTSTCSRTTPTPPELPIRLPRELPDRGGREFSRISDNLLPFLDPPADSWRWKAADAEGGDVLSVPAGRAHLGGRFQRDHRSRPIINTRDESHADAEKYRRSAM